ncbi:MAG TPA: helix-turn-helix transcriptional regulator [Anaerolineae bacterium]|nr:helix-turn-helix transcriptional regulator [Anaerolineae bacterium]
MAGHERRHDRARRAALSTLTRIGQEVREARLDHDLSQAVASGAVGMSKSAWSRLERGEAPRLSVVDLAAAAAVVGLDISVRAYPGGSPVRDRAHLELLERLRARLGPGARWRTEVVLPGTRDQRAWDALVLLSSVRVGVEAETRARDSQGLQRRLALKRRDGGVDHLILLLADTRHNRAFMRVAGHGFMSDFPVPGKDALARLEAGLDPLGSAIVLL